MDSHTTASPIAFEGYEKRLEISFAHPPLFSDPRGLGLRALTRPQIDSILDPAGCTVVATLSAPELDSYVLSESSLFVFPLKIVIKTCGTTRLLSSLAPILRHAAGLSLSVDAVRYSRGTFISPAAQPSPHRSFGEEVAALNEFFSGLGPRAYVLGGRGDPTRTWHVYSAAAEKRSPSAAEVGVEVCMTGLSREKAAVFFKDGKRSGSEMTRMSLVGEIIPGHEVCEFGFEPCGYSMNGIEDASYSTVHVTPEDGFSYASYEAGGLDPAAELDAVVGRAVACFAPARFSVAVTCRGGGYGARGRVDVAGYACEDVVRQEVPGGLCVVYRTYKAKAKWSAMRTGKKSLKKNVGGGFLKGGLGGEECEFVVARPCL